MNSDRDVNRIVRLWLDEGATVIPDHVLDAVLDQVPATQQRRAWRQAWFIRLNSYGKTAVAAFALVVIAVVGISLLPVGGQRGGAHSPAVSPSPSLSPTPSPSPAGLWSTADFEAIQVGRHDANLGGIGVSFAVPSLGWRSGITGMIEKGTYPKADHVYINFDMDNTALGVYADPCAHVLGPPIGSSVAALADALTTIPGTDAVGPTDVTVGGLPAKLVELTVHHDVGCAAREFGLYGVSKDAWWYVDSLDSTIRDWIVDVRGTRIVVHTDQSSPNDQTAREIQQIIDSIQFK